MPYVPYWFESFAGWFPLIVPMVSILSLWIARLCDDNRARAVAERIYYVMMMVVATGTLRTMLADEPCWLLHTGSLCIMVVGAVFPHTHLESDLTTVEYEGPIRKGV
jgi:hypothetical protein